MKLERVCEFLKHVPRYTESTDGTQCQVKCIFCGDSKKSDHGHLSIKIDLHDHEPMMYRCFRADCQQKGILTTSMLQQLGCTDMQTIIELAQYNQTISKNIDKPFNDKVSKGFEMVNLDISDNLEKLKYINRRLGTDFETSDLRDFKIQLGLYEFLRVNYIKRLSYKKEYCDVLDEYTIGFLSMYSDYLICRDISNQMVTGKRYTMYRTTGKPDPTDMKLYSIPTEIDLLDPRPAVINVAEGTFSILGAYLHTNLGREEKNSIWLANCGSEFENTIIHTAKQYGLLSVRIHIWSDSEIKLGKYEKLLTILSPRLDIKSFQVHYNTKSDDFGHPSNQIKINTITLK